MLVHRVRDMVVLWLTVVLLSVGTVGCGSKSVDGATLSPVAATTSLPGVYTATPAAPITATWTSAPTATAEPTSTYTPAPSPTPTASVEVLEQKWRIPIIGSALMYATVEQTLETARQRQAGEIDGFQALGGILVSGAIAKSVEDALTEWEPAPDQTGLRTALQAHVDTLQDVLSKWLDDEITSADVLGLLGPELAAIEETMTDVGRQAKAEGLPVASMEAMLDDAADALDETSEAVTPEPQGGTAPLQVVSDRSYVAGDWFHIIGEVQNTGALPMEFVKVVATLYDSDGNVVGTDFAYTMLDVVPPGGKAPFSLVTDDWVGTESYRLQIEGDQTGARTYALRVRSHRSYVDGEWYHIVGEVENAEAGAMAFVKVVATLHDGAGDVSGVDFTYTFLDVIGPGETGPFSLSIDRWEGTAEYVLDVEGTEEEPQAQDLEIASHTSQSDGSWLAIRGEVKNTGKATAEFVKVIATLYDAEGNVVGADFTYTSLDEILPGDTSPFEISTDEWAGMDHYRLQVQGD